jgi:hypothetical protein
LVSFPCLLSSFLFLPAIRAQENEKTRAGIVK